MAHRVRSIIEESNGETVSHRSTTLNVKIESKIPVRGDIQWDRVIDTDVLPILAINCQLKEGRIQRVIVGGS